MSFKKKEDNSCSIRNRKSHESEDLNDDFQELENINLNQDIFTRPISDNDPLWRVIAYLIGFLLADGSIFILKRTNSHQIYISQHIRDRDIIEIAQKAIGRGNITRPNKY